MKSNSNNFTGLKKTDILNNDKNQDLHNTYHSLYKGNINGINGNVIDQPCASNSWINEQPSSSSSDTLAKYTNIDEITDFKKLCIFSLPESDGYETSTIHEKREILLAREFGRNKEVRKRDEQADTDIGRESYAPDTKEERECITPESIEDSCIIQKEDLQNGYCRSDSLVSKEEQEDNMDKGNDSDSSSVINQDMDEMIVVTKKRRNRIKNNVDNNADNGSVLVKSVS
uniref:Uncharacterized protein n=1 Tax=Panagrolaimus superbus TaxID=310955 RepID=A0A914ZHC3_9BILA